MQSNNLPPALTSQNSHRSPKIKPLFATETKWRRLLPSDIAYINKCKPKMLKTLNISDYHDAQVRTQGIRNLRRALIDAKNISSLALGKENWIGFPQPSNYFGVLLGSSSHYKKLFLRIQGKRQDRALNENVAKALTRLRRCKDLSELEIHLSCHEQTKNKIITHLSSQLRGHRKLKIIHIDTNGCDNIAFQGAPADYDPNAPVLKFKYPSCLSSLTLNLESAISISQQTLSVFVLNLQRCHQLKSLSLNSNVIQTIYDPAPLFKPLTNSLKTLTLAKHISQQNIHLFLDGFSHLKNLIALDLYILSYLPKKLFKLFVTTLYNHLASFPNFKSLTLRISNQTESSLEFGLLFSQIQCLTQLEQLHIAFPSHADLDKPSLQSLSHALQQLRCLRKLNLDFPTYWISLEGIIYLALAFKNLLSLRDLSLQFPSANLNNKSIQIIFDSMAHLPLKNVDVHLGQSNTNMLTNLWKEKPKLTPLFSALYGFNLLTHLHLNLSAFRLSTAEAKHFSLALKELKQLSTFCITLSKFEAGNNHEGLRSFLACFKQIPKLSSLILSFIEEKMLDEKVRYLMESLQDCQRLRTFRLWFCEANRLTEDSIHYLSIGLKELKFLKELGLTFEREESFRDESIFELLESLTLLKHLETFDFGGFPRTKSHDIAVFAKNLVKQHKFKCLTKFLITSERI